MKKILIYLLLMLSFSGAFSQSKNLDANKINVRELLYSNGYSLIYPGDSTGQFDYDNVEDPVLDLDAVNLRSLRRWFATYLDTIVIGLDTFVTLPPDTFLNAYGNSWLHSGQTIEHPPLDTFYVEWLQDWVHSGETIPTNNDSIYLDSLDIWICNNCYIVTDSTNFYTRRSTCNYNCWYYSYNNIDWTFWFCLPEIEPQTKLYVFAKDTNILTISYKTDYTDADTIGYKANDRYINKWLYYGQDSIIWRQLPDSIFKGENWFHLLDTLPPDSLFMDGIWYALPDTLPINLDSLIYINNIPVSVGDSIYLTDSLFDEDKNTWLSGDDTIFNQRDSIKINNTWLNNGDSFNIDTSKWVYDINGFHSKNNENVGIGGNSDAINEFYVNGNSYFNGNIGIGSYYSSSYKLKIQTSETNKSGVDSYSQYGIGISAESTYERAAVFNGGIGGVLVTATSGTGGSFENHPAILEIERNNNEGYSLQYISCEDFFQVTDSGRIITNEITFPIYDGTPKQVLATHGDGYLYFDNVENLISALWNDTYNGISTAQKIGVGTNDANDNAMIYTDIQGDSIGILIEKYGSGDYLQFKDREDNTYFSVDSSGGTHTPYVFTDSINTTSLTVGDSTVTTIRNGATFTILIGTQAEYDAMSTHESKTIFFVEQNFNIIQIIFFLLMFFGSKGVFSQSDWANVYVGSTEMKKIYVGDKLVWEKSGGELICDSIYPTVTIGTQTWMAANLHCDDGEGGIYSYNNDTGISDEYGYLYTWSAAMRMDTLIDGWHLPSNAEINTLRIYLNSNGFKCNDVTNNILKAIASTENWTTSAVTCAVGNNQESNNSSGLNLKPAGNKSPIKGYIDIYYQSKIWSSTLYTITNWYYTLSVICNQATFSNSAAINTNALSVRLIKD